MRKFGPNDTVGHAIVGGGVIGPWHAGSIKDYVHGARLVACCDMVRERAEEFARRFANHGYTVIAPDLYCREGHGTPDEVAASSRLLLRQAP